jgi:hypothetical protein
MSGGVNSIEKTTQVKPPARKVTDRTPKPVVEDDSSDGLEFMDVKQETKLGPQKVTFAQKFGIGSSIDLKRKKIE